VVGPATAYEKDNRSQKLWVPIVRTPEPPELEEGQEPPEPDPETALPRVRAASHSPIPHGSSAHGSAALTVAAAAALAVRRCTAGGAAAQVRDPWRFAQREGPA
jgi:hypothetical protein